MKKILIYSVVSVCIFIIAVFVALFFIIFPINWTLALNIISVSISLLVACFIYRQAEAVNDQIKLQYIPSVEIFLVRDTGGERFVFLNSSSVPAAVVYELFFRQELGDEKIKKTKKVNYRVPSEGSLITQNISFIIGDKNGKQEKIEVKEGLLVDIRISIKSGLDNISKNSFGVYTKKYKFWKGKWDECTIGFPDILLFDSKTNFDLKTIQDETWKLVNSVNIKAK